MIAKLHIVTALRDEQTYLKTAFYTPPFKVVDITEDKREHWLRLMLMSSSPGILDGDEYHLKIEVSERCTLQLETQSYQRLFHMKDGATQQTEVHLAPGASFFFLPHPVVPHEGACFNTGNRIFLSAGCSLLWSDVLTCGRKGSGEVFLFSKYHNTTEIFLENRLVVKENVQTTPLINNVHTTGLMEGYTHQATLIYIHKKTLVQELIIHLTNLLAVEKKILFGLSALSVNGLSVRLLGHSGEQLHRCVKMLAAQIALHTMQQSVYPTPKAYVQGD